LGPGEKEGGEVKTLKGNLRKSLLKEKESWNKRQKENGNGSFVPEGKTKQ
jgi:hypothetical protein